jgi:hypothetical protein
MASPMFIYLQTADKMRPLKMKQRIREESDKSHRSDADLALPTKK